MNSLNGKVALITGASSGIGRAATHLFASEGAALVLGARRQNELATLAADIQETGGRVAVLAGDVCDETYADALVNLAVTRFGGLDIAFNNAGTLGKLQPLTDMTLTDWQAVLNVNLTAAFLGARRQIPALLARGGGSLIFTSSFVGHTAGFPCTSAYAASKAGLIGLTQALAAEFGASGLRVNALPPDGTDTPMAHEMNTSPETMEQVARLHALQRLAQPEEIAQAALFLASSASSFMTGTAMLVDGGVSVKRA